MPTGYTEQIITGKVKNPKDFLHLCLRNFGICYFLRDEPISNSSDDYTDQIYENTQKNVDYHKMELSKAEDHLKEIERLSDDELYLRYVQYFYDQKKCCEEMIQKNTEINLKYRQFEESISKWECSLEYQNIKDFALEQLRISKEGTDYYEKQLSEIGDLSREDFEGKKEAYRQKLIQDAQWSVDYHKKELDLAIKKQAESISFYHFFKEEIKKIK